MKEIEFIGHESFTTDPEIVKKYLYPADEDIACNSKGNAKVVLVLNDPF